jgi:preprotein translocase subunit SecY
MALTQSSKTTSGLASKMHASNGAGKKIANSDLISRLMFLLMALAVYRLGSHIPVPGINPDELAKLFQTHSGGVLGMFNLFSGGALSRFTIFALGIMPYISASIIMQLLTLLLPSFEAMKKEGQAGQRKITQYTRYATVFLAAFQAVAISIALEAQVGLVLQAGMTFKVVAVISLVTGTLFLMWLGEQITERGLGNGISMIILSGIISGLPSAFSGFFELVSQGSIGIFSAIIIIALAIAVTIFAIYVERAQRKVLINYAKRQVGNKLYGGQATHLPLKLNMAGVIPPIFASSIILFPATIVGWLSTGRESASGFYRYLKDISVLLSPGHPLYMILYAAAIMFFCYFYTALVFNSKETAEQLKKTGAFVPGIRPGIQTASYIDSILSKLTLYGALYMILICLLPEFLVLKWQVPFYFGGTSLLIIVMVTMDFMSQIQAQRSSTQYAGLMKKNNFR